MDERVSDFIDRPIWGCDLVLTLSEAPPKPAETEDDELVDKNSGRISRAART
jgi:hypothetical protein